MLYLTFASLFLLTLLIVYDLVVTIPFIRTVTAKPDYDITETSLPKAAIIMCLRGADPFLPRCIEGLLNQDYPDFCLYLIIDSKSDPSNNILNKSILEKYHSRLNIQILEKPLPNCSLKCASQVQAIRSLDPDIKIIAFADADIIPYPKWLLSLVIPLLPEKAGASTGNRWYMPEKNPGFGTIVRYVWNSAAMISMYWLKIPWGGSMAIKRTVFDNTDIIEHWENALCEDTSLNEYLKKVNLDLVFSPSLIMFNHEDCSLKSFLIWETRQILNNRLHHPLWLAIVAHAFGMVGIVLLNLFLLIITIFSNLHLESTLLIAGLLIYSIIISGLLIIMEYRMTIIARERGVFINWININTFLMVIIAIPLAHILHPVVVARALAATKVEWRGIQYIIEGHGKIRMVDYKPYEETQIYPGNKESI